jgi:lysophospholipase L1-like esterase
VTFNRRTLIQGTLAAPLLFGSVSAAAKQAFSGKGDWTQWFHDWELKDFGMIGYYADDNAKLLASHAPVDVVFLGDSITEGWFDKHPSYFVNGRVDRGIGGQTSSQMVLRMMSDVVDLKPKAVHIMAGTNDVAGNTGPMTAKMTEDNFRVMSDIARANRIKVLIASIPPAGAFPWRPGLEVKQPIAELNRRLKAYAHSSGATWVDYWPVLNDGTGAMKPGLAVDGVHPTVAGYQAMETVITPILKRVLA